jgi:hypothetical protein
VPPADIPTELEPPELAAVPPDRAALLVALDPASALLVLDRLLVPAELLAGWLPLLPEPLEQPNMATPKMVASKGLVDERPDLIRAFLRDVHFAAARAGQTGPKLEGPHSGIAQFGRLGLCSGAWQKENGVRLASF